MAQQFVFQTESDAHARAVAAALLEAAGGDATRFRTVTGQNGRVAYAVDEELSGTTVPGPEEAHSDTVTGAYPDGGNPPAETKPKKGNGKAAADTKTEGA